jgi:predicted NAD/FAD-binding protein
MKVGIIGSGISGLTAAHHLQRRHEVVLFETERRPGGHTHTVDVLEGDRRIPVDTGFIVYNTKTYPHFVKMLAELGVGSSESEMSLSVRSDRRDFEYAGRNLSALFAQRRRLLSPRFLRMVRDIGRFYREAGELLGEGPELPIVPWLKERRYSDAFIEDHLLPMLRAVWSANRESAVSFPARFLVRFFDNHGFLQLRDAPRWRTIPGGSRTYVDAILRTFSGEVRLGAGVRSLRRVEGGALVCCDGAPPERFDHIVVACHADQALALLADPSELERTVLGAIPFQSNQAVLHTDESLMPSHRRAWACWNVHLDDEGVDGACLTYWMNRLQPLRAKRNYFVTLNRSGRIRPELILRSQTFAHPVFTAAGLRAQARHPELIDHRNTSYVGAYWRNGFHEDGVVSALRVVDRLMSSQLLDRDAA